jgi:hypothetical protein
MFKMLTNKIILAIYDKRKGDFNLIKNDISMIETINNEVNNYHLQLKIRRTVMKMRKLKARKSKEPYSIFMNAEFSIPTTKKQPEQPQTSAPAILKANIHSYRAE